jgi:hypothetical protein
LFVRPGIDADRGRQARPQFAEARVSVIERDADRDALNDLGKVAGGVLRRDHAEDRPGARCQAEDMAVEDLARPHVGDHRRWLPRLHMRQLILLEIRVDPEPVRGGDAQQVSAAGDIGADLPGPVADIAVDRRADLGVAEIEAGGFQIRLGLGHARPRGGDFRIPHGQLLPGGGKPCLGRFGRRLRFLVDGRRSLGVLPRTVAGQRQAAVADGVLAGKRGAGNLGVEVGLGLADHSLLQDVLGFEPGERGPPLIGDCLGMIECRLEIARIEPDQQLPGFDMLVVCHQDFRNESCDMRRHRRDVAAGIGIIGALDEAPDGPPLMAVFARPDRDE